MQVHRDDYMTTAFSRPQPGPSPSLHCLPGPPIHSYLHVPLTPDDLSWEEPNATCYMIHCHRRRQIGGRSWETTFDPHSFDWSIACWLIDFIPHITFIQRSSHHPHSFLPGCFFHSWTSRSKLVAPEKRHFYRRAPSQRSLDRAFHTFNKLQCPPIRFPVCLRQGPLTGCIASFYVLPWKMTDC